MKENKWKLESRREWQYYVMDSAVIDHLSPYKPKER